MGKGSRWEWQYDGMLCVMVVLPGPRGVCINVSAVTEDLCACVCPWVLEEGHFLCLPKYRLQFLSYAFRLNYVIMHDPGVQEKYSFLSCIDAVTLNPVEPLHTPPPPGHRIFHSPWSAIFVVWQSYCNITLQKRNIGKMSEEFSFQL